MDMVFLGKQIVPALVLPRGGPLLVALLGLALLRRMPRLGRALSWTGVGTLFALALPVVSASLMRLATDGPVLDLSSAKAAQAIVVLAGGLRYDAAEYDGDTMNGLSLDPRTGVCPEGRRGPVRTPRPPLWARPRPRNGPRAMRTDRW